MADKKTTPAAKANPKSGAEVKAPEQVAEGAKTDDAKSEKEVPKHKTPAVMIRAMKDGFRRCGMAHSKAPVVHEAGTFSVEQLEILANEEMLSVIPADGPETNT